MKNNNRWHVITLMVLAIMLLAACTPVEAGPTKIEPAKIETIEGSEFQRVTLTERAAERLGIETDTVHEAQVNGKQEMVVPYDAIIYGLSGETWVYTSPSPLTYVREAITVDRIEDGMVVLVDGPPVGTAVVTVGVAELYGTDTGVGK